MPAAYYIDAERGVIFIRAWDVVTERDVTTVGLAVKADARFDARFTRIENLIDVTDMKVSTPVVQRVAKAHERAPAPRRAFVVRSDAVFGMIRMLELYANAEPDTFLLSRDLAEGFRWVGLDPASGWPEDALFTR